MGLFSKHVADGLKMGDPFTFGRYQGEAIEWHVLWRSQRGRQIHTLLLADEIIDIKPFNQEAKSVIWGACSLRAWLNDEFLYSAFDASERKSIREVENNEGVPGWVVKGMNVSRDKVFCLSSYEAHHYFRNRYDLKCEFSDYAKSKKDNDYRWWWLRSSNHDGSSAASERAAFIQGDCYNTTGVTHLLGVRPAIWIM